MASDTISAPDGATRPATHAFGRVFTDRMAVATYRRASGWSPIDVEPLHAFSLHPASMVFHYGQAIFEGCKAFRGPDGTLALFRPADNARRFARSARRLAMPPLPEDAFVDACRAVVAAAAGAVPDAPGAALYLRPMMIATEASLGVRASDEYLFAVIASPAGSYFGDRAAPLTVWASREYVRAAPGGTGYAKCGGNYGGSLAAKADAHAHGCDETLWLDAHDRRWVEEMGGMNIMFVDTSGARPVLVTPPVGDTILDGVTRASLLTLAPGLGIDVLERPVAIDELDAPGPFREAFACGTAAVVAPIGRVRSTDREVVIGDGEPGPVTLRLRDALVAIQEGRAADPFGWRMPVVGR
jgi:branched-chain amino acid aminotransferase